MKLRSVGDFYVRNQKQHGRLYLPAWLRWILLLPVALAGGWVVGYGIYVLNASQAARPDAPIVYIADFAGSVASNLVSFYLAYTIAPGFKSRVVTFLVVIAMLASFWAVYLVVERNDFIELIGIAGNILGCVLVWRKYVIADIKPESLV